MCMIDLSPNYSRIPSGNTKTELWTLEIQNCE